MPLRSKRCSLDSSSLSQSAKLQPQGASLIPKFSWAQKGYQLSLQKVLCNSNLGYRLLNLIHLHLTYLGLGGLAICPLISPRIFQQSVVQFFQRVEFRSSSLLSTSLDHNNYKRRSLCWNMTLKSVLTHLLEQPCGDYFSIWNLLLFCNSNVLYSVVSRFL